ncbi:MAG: hypothetical protein ACI89L_002318 [Phycisphaerales bacterium]|jgi:hypothetical protein
MPITTTVVVKSFAALLATGLGTLGGFNYVTGGNIWGTGNDYPSLSSPTSISSVASDFTPPAPTTVSEPTSDPAVEPVTQATPATESLKTEPVQTESAQPDDTEADDSCCTPTGRAGILAEPRSDETSDFPEPIDPAASEG